MEGRGSGGGAHLAILAGIFATAGSLLGKLAGGADSSSLVSWWPIRIAGKMEMCSYKIPIQLSCIDNICMLLFYASSKLPSMFLKGALLVFMIVCNTVGCTFFVKALHGSGSSLPITVASAATNYVCSALVGSVVFDESTSLTWWCGTSLVLLGLMLICNVPAEKKASAVEEKLKHQ